MSDEILMCIEFDFFLLDGNFQYNCVLLYFTTDFKLIY